MKILAAAILATALVAAGGAEAQIRIAVAGPMTGSLAILGAQIRAGVETAVRLINEAGGLLGEEVVLQIADDGCAEDRAPAIANQLAGAGVVFVVGHLCSAPAIAAAAVYAAEDIIAIAPGAPDPRLTEERPGPGIFRLFGREDAQGPAAAAFLLDQAGDGIIAVIDDSSPYGLRLAEAVATALEEAGRPADVLETYSVADTAFAALVTRLRERGVTAVFVAGTAGDVAALRLEMAAQDYRPLLIGGDTLASEAFAEEAGAEATGTFFTYQPDPTLNPDAADAVDAIVADGGFADGFALHAFAAVEVWAAAVTAAGTTGHDAVAAAIAEGTFDTALGPIAFNEIGDVALAGWIVNQWQDGVYRPWIP